MHHRLFRRALLPIAALAATAASASTASAGIWTAVPSGTTADITAVEDAPGKLVIGTSNGQILKNGTVRSVNPGYTINDVALNPSGTIGIAAASNGRMLRTTNGGDTWGVKSLANTSYTTGSPCNGIGPLPKTYAPTGNLNAVAWASDTVAYTVAADLGVVLKTTDGGNTWNDVSRRPDGSCWVNAGNDILTDVKTLPGTDFVWIVSDGFGQRYFSSNGLASSAVKQADSGANCFDHRPQMAIDVDNPNRAFVVDRCNGALQFGFTQDSGSTYELSRNWIAGDGDALTGLNDVAMAGGSALAVGNGGAILVSPDINAYFQKADGPDATNDWLAVDKRDANNATVGGRGGRLLTTTQASAIPDVVAPAGTISGPVTAVAGVPQTYTANVADNAGGTGIDPAGFTWSATGVPAAGGNPATLTFPSAGFYTVKVAFKDLAGNAAQATLAVRVSAPTTPPVPKPPTGTTSPVKTATATVAGAKITLGVPRGCVNPGQTFTVTLTWKKQKKKGNRFVKVRRADFYIGKTRVKIDKKAPFRQTLRVKAGTKAGSTVTVRAQAFIKVSKGKSPKKSIKTTVKVCG